VETKTVGQDLRLGQEALTRIPLKLASLKAMEQFFRSNGLVAGRVGRAR
jgi:hypothetical protein